MAEALRQELAKLPPLRPSSPEIASRSRKNQQYPSKAESSRRWRTSTQASDVTKASASSSSIWSSSTGDTSANSHASTSGQSLVSCITPASAPPSEAATTPVKLMSQEQSSLPSEQQHALVNGLAAPFSAPPTLTAFHNGDDAMSTRGSLRGSPAPSMSRSQSVIAETAATPSADQPETKKKRGRTATGGSARSTAASKRGRTATPASSADVDATPAPETSTKAAAKLGKNATPGHKRKISQNSLWHASRAILGQGIGGGLSPSKSQPSLDVASMAENAAGATFVSPTRSVSAMTVNTAVGKNRSSSVVTMPSIVSPSLPNVLSTPRRNTLAQINAPHTVAHTYIPSNLGPNAMMTSTGPQMINFAQPMPHNMLQGQLLPNNLVSPSNTYASHHNPLQLQQQQQHQQQMYMPLMTPSSQPNMYIPMSAPPMLGQLDASGIAQGDFGAANALTSFNYDPASGMMQSAGNAFAAPMQLQLSTGPQQLMQLQMQQPEHLTMARPQLSRSPSDMSFGTGTATGTLDASSYGTLHANSSQESATTVDHGMSASGHQLRRPQSTSDLARGPIRPKLPIGVGSQDSEAAAEDLLLFAASPSPQQPSKKASNFNLLGGDLGGMKGRRLFSNDDDPAGDFSVMPLPASSNDQHLTRGMSHAGKAQRDHPQTLMSFSTAGPQTAPPISSTTFSHSAPAGPPFNMSMANASFQTFPNRLAQPFEFQQQQQGINNIHFSDAPQIMDGTPNTGFRFNEYSIVDQSAPIAVDHQFGDNPW